jgi:hypothetical protein
VTREIDFNGAFCTIFCRPNLPQICGRFRIVPLAPLHVANPQRCGWSQIIPQICRISVNCWQRISRQICRLIVELGRPMRWQIGDLRAFLTRNVAGLLSLVSITGTPSKTSNSAAAAAPAVKCANLRTSDLQPHRRVAFFKPANLPVCRRWRVSSNFTETATLTPHSAGFSAPLCDLKRPN